jgi:O-succinylbenzoate synthase
MLRIHRLTVREIRMELKESFRISSGTAHARRILLVEVRDPDGCSGWGECVAGEAPNYSPETVDTAWLALRLWIAPRVVGRAFEDPAALYQHLETAFRGHRMAKACVEMAAWDLAARLRNLPLARLLGGTRDRIATGISLGIEDSPGALVAKARASLEAGYRRVKLKIAPGADVEFVRAVRDALGPTAPLTVDANSAYTPADTEHLRRLDGFALMMIEQPLACDDLVRHARLQRELQTAICLDESITSPDRAADMIALRSGRIINVKPGRVGGFCASKAIHDLTTEHGIPVWCGGMLESGVGRAHNVALASLPNFTLPGDVSPSARYWTRDIVEPEWTMQDGMVAVPLERPGIGVEVDRKRVDALTVRHETFDRGERAG